MLKRALSVALAANRTANGAIRFQNHFTKGRQLVQSRVITEPAKFLALKLTPCGADELIDWLTSPHEESRAAAYLNAHTVNLGFADQSFAKSLNAMDVVYADGMAVVKEARRRGIPARERVSAADFFMRFLWVATNRKCSLAFVGGPPGLAEKCADHLRGQVPGLDVILVHDGYFAGGGAKEDALIAALKQAGPAIVLLGMGSPRQEALALRLRDEARLPTVWCVGALFEYFTPGHRRHAPPWMREWGLEWLFRLIQEPRRLARRYLIGNLKFLVRCWTWK